MNKTGTRPARAAARENHAERGRIPSLKDSAGRPIISLIALFLLPALQSCAPAGEIAEKVPGGICERTYVRDISMDLDLGIYEAEAEEPGDSVLKASPLYGTVRKTGSGFSYSPDCRGKPASQNSGIPTTHSLSTAATGPAASTMPGTTLIRSASTSGSSRTTECSSSRGLHRSAAQTSMRQAHT